MTKDEQWLLQEKYNGVKTSAYEADVERLARGEPLAYVIGFQPFLGLKIWLDSKPLIPRPETEWWTEQLIESMETGSAPERTLVGFAIGGDAVAQMPAALRSRQKSAPTSASRQAKPTSVRVLDLCAGSGAIGCAILEKIPDAQVYFGEIDSAHEATILKNIRENNLDESRAIIGIGDLFAPFTDIRFDVIAANPPYIPSGRELPASVADHEPAVALFSEEDGLGVIRRIAIELPGRLAPGGFAWIECDSAHAAAACALFETQGFKAEIRTDQYDVPRVIVVSFT